MLLTALASRIKRVPKTLLVNSGSKFLARSASALNLRTERGQAQEHWFNVGLALHGILNPKKGHFTTFDLSLFFI